MLLRNIVLVVYLPLNVEEYSNTKYRFRDVSDKKKNAETPMMVKVKSNRGLKYALELIEVVLAGEVKNPPVEQADYVEHEIPKELLEGAYVKRSFIGEICQMGVEVQDYYSRIKNAVLSYKKVDSRISFSFESFKKGRTVYARMAVRGKTLVLYLALNPDEYVKTKYHARNVSGVKKYADTPTMVKVKSERGVKYAIELVNKALESIAKNKDFVEVKYYEPYKNNAKLLDEGLAKIIKLSTLFI